MSTGRIVANALAIVVVVGALLLALLTSGCLGQVEDTEPEWREPLQCSPGPPCPDETPHCAVLPTGNECRPGCADDADCDFGARCVPLGSGMVCERWLSKGYRYPYGE